MALTSLHTAKAVDGERNMHLASSDGLQGDINHPSPELPLMAPDV
jgi:hypothetical protein